MSAGTSNDNLRVSSDLMQLAPLFRAAVQTSIQQCHDKGFDAMVYEAYRSQELQALYYARGRTIRPPLATVTNAPNNLFSWHGYGLAVDVISRSRGWDVPLSWFQNIAAIFKANNCSWGGDWKMKDLPHFQWYLCKPSPSADARTMITTQGAQAVWRAVNAIEVSPVVLEAARKGVVAVDGLHLRRDPSTTNPPIATLQQGAPLDVLEPHGDWVRVRANGLEGFVAAKYVTLSTGPAPAPLVPR